MRMVCVDASGAIIGVEGFGNTAIDCGTFRELGWVMKGGEGVKWDEPKGR
jgi:hypothetical protein